MSLISRYAALLLLTLFIALPSFAQTPPPTSEALTAQAKEAVAKEDWIVAMATVLRLDTSYPEATKAPEVQDAIRKTLQELNKKARAEAEGERPEEGLRIAQGLVSPQALALVGKVFPQNVESLVDSMRIAQGVGLWKMGQRHALRGKREEAEKSYSDAMGFLKEGDRRYPQLLHDRAILFRDRGLEALRLNDQKEAESLLKNAQTLFEMLYQSAAARAGDPTLVELAKANITEIAATGLAPIQVPGFTPTPTPTPTPVPTFLDTWFGGGLGGGFAARLKSGDGTVTYILIGVGVLVGVVLLYWIIPAFFLGWFAHRGDVRAAEAKDRVKFLGPIAILTWTIAKYSDSRVVVDTRKKHGCPSCGFGLDDPFAYEDMVFSRCPKCKAQVTPMYSVEGLITLLANSLATDVERVNSGASSLDKFVERDAMIRLIRAIVTLAVRRRASDLHVEPDERQLVIRQRIDGIMTEMVSLPRSLSLAIVSAIKVTANLDISEKRKPQDGKLTMSVDKTEIDIRVATSPSGAGEKVSMRLLDCRSIQLEVRHLGMAQGNLEIFEKAVGAPHGLVLVSGPTGSGKTTTLYVALQSLKSGAKNIISIEDPIEFRIPGVNQIQVNPTAGLTFAAGLRSILRQDPDVIMVGEIRDHETAEISINAATTGHLVFSTLHTIDASSSVARLIDLGVGPRQFADALSLIIAQRLVRLICQSCIEEYVPTSEEISKLELRAGTEPKVLKRGKGCPVCNGTGHYRRMGIFEMLQPSDRLRGAIESGKLSTSEIRELAIAGGMKTLRQESITMLLNGTTTVEETLRMTK